ncbi:MAG TPA: hypothetical protein VF773_21480 [Verrucomicrobiae bacterium]
MIFKQFKRRTITFVVLAFVLVLAIPAAYLWFTAPADPKFNGKRLSTLLYEAYGSGMPSPRQIRSGTYQPHEACREALKHLGPKAAPLLTDWLEMRPSPLRDKIRRILFSMQINWPYFTADHQDIVERMLYQIPEAAVPISEAFQYQIMHGDPELALRWASLCTYVINSADEPSQRFIASRSGPIVHALLDRFEKDGNDNYSLHLVGLIVKNHPEHLTPELKERILRLVKKSRYLEPAETFIKSQRSGASTSGVPMFHLGHHLHTPASDAQSHVVMAKAFKFVVPKEFAAVRIEAKQMPHRSSENFAVVIENRYVRVTGGGEKTGFQFRAPNFSSAIDIDRGDVAIASDIQTLGHSWIVPRPTSGRDYKTRGRLQCAFGRNLLSSSQRGECLPSIL